MHGETAKRFRIGLNEWGGIAERTTGEGDGLHALKEWIEAAQTEPTEKKPEGQREHGGRAENVEMHCRAGY